MKIKYNPFIASSILMAVLLWQLESGKPGKRKDPFEFEPDLKEGEQDVIAFFEKHQAEAKRDTQKVVYPENSIFRKRHVPVLLWNVSEEKTEKRNAKDWNVDQSKKVKCVLMGSNLSDKMIRNEIKYRLSDHGETPMSMDALTHKGEAMVISGIDELFSDASVQKKLMEIWKKRESAKKEVKETATQEPPAKEDGEIAPPVV